MCWPKISGWDLFLLTSHYLLLKRQSFRPSLRSKSPLFMQCLSLNSSHKKLKLKHSALERCQLCRSKRKSPASSFRELNSYMLPRMASQARLSINLRDPTSYYHWTFPNPLQGQLREAGSLRPRAKNSLSG